MFARVENESDFLRTPPFYSKIALVFKIHANIKRKVQLNNSNTRTLHIEFVPLHNRGKETLFVQMTQGPLMRFANIDVHELRAAIDSGDMARAAKVCAV